MYRGYTAAGLARGQRHGLRRPDRRDRDTFLRGSPGPRSTTVVAVSATCWWTSTILNHAQYALVGNSWREAPRSHGRSPASRASSRWWATRPVSSTRSGGADIRNITDFERDFPSARTILLEQNHRSTQHPLRGQRGDPPERGPPGRSGGRPRGDGVPIVGCAAAKNEHEEARFIAEEIDRLQDEHGSAPGRGRVLPHQGPVPRSWRRSSCGGAAVQGGRGTRFYQRKEIKDAISYLRAIAHPSDDITVRLLSTSPSADRPTCPGVDRQPASARGSASAAMHRLDQARPWPPVPPTRSARSPKLMDDLANWPRGRPVAVLEACWEQSGYLEAWRMSQRIPQDESRAENLAEPWPRRAS
ncbi:hypothetical protein QJS66_09030 [Kocuria rhizophila]|nr:hypothetical protein QJS66_09030 [Kocuria rhizophila]